MYTQRVCAHKPILYLLTFILFYCHTITVFASTKAINFAQAVTLAMRANPKMKASTANIESASAGIIEARSMGLPKLNMEVNAARSDNPLNVFGYKLSQGKASFADFGFAEYNGPGSINTIPTALNSPGYYSNFDTGFVITIPIFSGGATVAKSKQAQYLLAAAYYGDEAAKTQLTYEILQAYEGVHVTKKLLDIAKQSLQSADVYVRTTKQLFKQSLVTQSDVLLVEAYRRSSFATMKVAETEVNSQLDLFRVTIGQANSQYIPGSSIHLSQPGGSIRTLEKKAFLSNTQLMALRSRVDASHTGIVVANAHNWPQINLQLRHDWNSEVLGLQKSSNTALLQVNWRLFSSGAQYGAGKQAAAEFNHASAELGEASDQLRINVARAVRAIKTAEIEYEASTLNKQQIQKALELLVMRYGQGVIPLGQLLDCQSRLDTAKAKKIIAQYNVLLEKAKLLMLTNHLYAYRGSVKANT